MEAHADKVLVVWPRTCAASGEPIGALDLSLNPDWASRLNEVDYEVVVPGKKHTLLEHCRTTSRLFALATSAFPRGTRTATADDTLIGQKTGELFAILPALDLIDITKRIDFFGKDPQVLRTPFRFEPVKADAKGAQAVHDVLAVEGFGRTEFQVVVKRVVYTYADGGSLSATSPASGSPSTSPTPTTTTPPTTAPADGGTRWVYLAAIGGLVVGGLIAFFRKKRDAAK
jgi:hypothetical protein